MNNGLANCPWIVICSGVNDMPWSAGPSSINRNTVAGTHRLLRGSHGDRSGSINKASSLAFGVFNVCGVNMMVFLFKCHRRKGLVS